MQAFTGLPVAVNIYGQDRDGRTYSDMLFMGGGQGAWSRGDGKSGLLWPTSAANTSIELFEARVPVLVLEKGYVARFRRRRRTSRRARPARPSAQAARRRHDDPGLGLSGRRGQSDRRPLRRQAGRRGSGRVVDANGRVLRDCGTGELVQLTTTNEIVEMVLAGGSGYGDPRKRSREAILRDIALGSSRSMARAATMGLAMTKRRNARLLIC